MDEFTSRGIFTNETAASVKRVTILDPVAEKLQCFFDSGLLGRDSIFHSLVENSVNYVNWLNERKRNHSLQYPMGSWSPSVYRDSWISWRNESSQCSQRFRSWRRGWLWNTHLWLTKIKLPSVPGKTTRDKQYEGYTTEDGIHANLLPSFLLSFLSGKPLPHYEDEKVTVYRVVVVKEAMQIKPGLLYDF